MTKRVSLPEAPDLHCCTEECIISDGSIVVIQRGGCGFDDKARNAEQLGAAAVVIVNDRDDEPAFPMGAPAGDANSPAPLKIPVVMVSRKLGVSLSAIANAPPEHGNTSLFIRHQSLAAVYLPFVKVQDQSSFKLNPSIRVTSQVATLPTPFHIYVHDPQNCRFISKNLVETGRWEDSITNRFIEIMGAKENGLFVDVGANVGWFTLLMAAMGNQVVAIEPMQYNRELLEASMKDSGLESLITVHKTGVGEKIAGDGEESRMCVLPAFDGDPEANTGNGQLHPLTDENRAQCTDIIQVSTLDVLLGEVNQRIHAIKLDIEGFETLALRGAKGLLKSNPPCHIIIEYWKQYVEWTGVGQYELFESLWGYGYRSFSLEGEEVTKKHLATVKDADYEFRHPSCLDDTGSYREERYDEL